MGRVKRPYILTVDDAKAVRRIVEQVLAPYECDTGEANNGFNALFALEERRADLIVLDLNMPIMDGLDFLERIRTVPELAKIPVVMLVSPADHAHMGKLPGLGVNAHLVKPFQPAALLAQVQAILPLRARAAV